MTKPSDSESDDEYTQLEELPGLSSQSDKEAPASIGPYRLQRLLGSGGMGEVYLAEQTEPVERQVAIKLIRAELAQSTGRAMFEVECALLARMHHPYIAQVLDAGETDEGRPWFAMEWVRGEPILVYCAERVFGLKDRLTLFLRVCQGVQHAHQRGILHRDLKPANILVSEVDGRAVPKLIDFGVATTLIGESQTGIVRTDRAGTRAYMSPEQLAGDPASLDTRTDVYALGILLFELLTELRPLVDSAGDALTSFCATLQTRSVQAATRADLGFSPEALAAARELPEELRWIIARAISPNRERRYASAAALADEISRHLNNRPVEAVPPTLRYRWRKFLSRNRLPVAAGAMVLVALLSGLALATWGLTQAQAERDRARIQAERAEQSARFVQNLFRSVNPIWAEGYDTGLLRQLLGQGAERAVVELAQQPQVLADIQYTIGSAYRAVGELERARTQTASAVALSESAGPRPVYLGALVELAQIELMLGQEEQALELIERALGPIRSEFAPADSLTLAALIVKGGILKARQQYAEAEVMLLEAVDNSTGVEDNSAIAERLSGLRILAQVYSDDFRFDQAIERFRQTLAELSAWDDPRAEEAEISTLNDLAVVYLRQQEYAQAEPLLRRALAMGEDLFGSDHPTVLPSVSNLAGSLRQQGRPAEALPFYQRARDSAYELYGPDHPQSLATEYNLANCLLDLGRTDEALSLHRAALDAALRLEPDNRFRLGMFRLGLGRSARAAGLLDEAREALSRAVDDLEATAGADFHRTIEARENLSGVQAELAVD
ncbi:MAG: tetratricopeptide repeat protein [Wenzhouxiangella sp.]|nr:tetratricopeptide repeat protein [Wenzhouxiangella sp.]